MPRTGYTRIPAILKTAASSSTSTLTPRAAAPRLWNAKKRITRSVGLPARQLALFKKDPDSVNVESFVSEDVAAFWNKARSDEMLEAGARPLTEEQEVKLLSNPSQYFSRPENVPLALRQQVYFPDFPITLLRTPHKSPYYAAFAVPLWMNKIDIKTYLLQVYNVEVVHVRSSIYQPGKTHKKHPFHRRGRLFRPKSFKRMTCQLVEPFVWPAEVENMTDYDKEDHWHMKKMARDVNLRNSLLITKQPMRPLVEHRHKIAVQAHKVLTGTQKVVPTWTQFEADRKIMQGIADKVPLRQAAAAATRAATNMTLLPARDREPTAKMLQEAKEEDFFETLPESQQQGEDVVEVATAKEQQAEAAEPTIEEVQTEAQEKEKEVVTTQRPRKRKTVMAPFPNTVASVRGKKLSEVRL